MSFTLNLSQIRVLQYIAKRGPCVYGGFTQYDLPGGPWCPGGIWGY